MELTKEQKEILLPKVEKFSENIRVRLTAHFDTVYPDTHQSVTKDLPGGGVLDLYFDSNVTEYETEPNLTLEFNSKYGESVVIASNCKEVDYDKIVDTLSTTDYALIKDNLSPLARELHDNVFKNITLRSGVADPIMVLNDSNLSEMTRDMSHNSFATIETDDKNGMTVGYLVRDDSDINAFLKDYDINAFLKDYGKGYVKDVMDEKGVDGLILVSDDKVKGVFTRFDVYAINCFESMDSRLPSMSERIGVLKETSNQLQVLIEQNSERAFASALSVLDNDELRL